MCIYTIIYLAFASIIYAITQNRARIQRTPLPALIKPIEILDSSCMLRVSGSSRSIEDMHNFRALKIGTNIFSKKTQR